MTSKRIEDCPNPKYFESNRWAPEPLQVLVWVRLAEGETPDPKSKYPGLKQIFVPVSAFLSEKHIFPGDAQFIHVVGTQPFFDVDRAMAVQNSASRASHGSKVLKGPLNNTDLAKAEPERFVEPPLSVTEGISTAERSWITSVFRQLNTYLKSRLRDFDLNEIQFYWPNSTEPLAEMFELNGAASPAALVDYEKLSAVLQSNNFDNGTELIKGLAESSQIVQKICLWMLIAKKVTNLADTRIYHRWTSILSQKPEVAACIFLTGIGISNRAIANILNIGQEAVATHLNTFFRPEARNTQEISGVLPLAYSLATLLEFNPFSAEAARFNTMMEPKMVVVLKELYELAQGDAPNLGKKTFNAKMKRHRTGWSFEKFCELVSQTTGARIVQSGEWKLLDTATTIWLGRVLSVVQKAVPDALRRQKTKKHQWTA